MTLCFLTPGICSGGLIGATTGKAQIIFVFVINAPRIAPQKSPPMTVSAFARTLQAAIGEPSLVKV